MEFMVWPFNWYKLIFTFRRADQNIAEVIQLPAQRQHQFLQKTYLRKQRAARRYPRDQNPGSCHTHSRTRSSWKLSMRSARSVVQTSRLRGRRLFDLSLPLHSTSLKRNWRSSMVWAAKLMSTLSWAVRHKSCYPLEIEMSSISMMTSTI